MPRYRMVVHGRVQGVGFRWTCLQNAKKNGLLGPQSGRRRCRIGGAGAGRGGGGLFRWDPPRKWIQLHRPHRNAVGR